MLEHIFFDNTVKDYLIVFAVILVSLIIKKIISKYCAGLLYKMIGKAGRVITKQAFFNLIVQPLELFVFLFIAFVTLDKLNFPSALEFKVFKHTSREIVDSISNGLLVIIFIWLCIRLIDFTAMVLEEKANTTNDTTDNQLIVFFKDFFKVILIIIGVLMVLHFSFHRNIGNLFTGLSIVGAAIALATRESLENLIASFIIFFDKPFATGDTVKVLQFSGTVEKIGLRSTRIRTESKTFITVPNKQMVDSVVDNISLRTQRKAEIKLEMDISNSAEQLLKLMTSIRKKLAENTMIETPHIYLSETGKQAHIITIDFFAPITQNAEEFNHLKESVNFEIIKLTQAMQMKFAITNIIHTTA